MRRNPKRGLNGSEGRHITLDSDLPYHFSPQKSQNPSSGAQPFLVSLQILSVLSGNDGGAWTRNTETPSFLTGWMSDHGRSSHLLRLPTEYCPDRAEEETLAASSDRLSRAGRGQQGCSPSANDEDSTVVPSSVDVEELL